MFRHAYAKASRFTQPLIVAYRYFDKTVASGLGSFVILNEDAWIMTAAHNLDASFTFTAHQKQVKEYNDQKSLGHPVEPNPKWVTSFIIWFGVQGLTIQESYVYPDHDLAFLRVNKSAVEGFTDFPKIKDPDNMQFGTSLCKLGYPFHIINVTFDESTNGFVIPQSQLPVPRFPIDGIYTRNVVQGKSNDGAMDVMFLETSSPGLKGQSGGPIFDADGHLYAIQSKNFTIPLGFHGTVEINGQKVEENQFINVGIGVHGKTIVALLRKHNIKFDMVP